MSNAEDFWAWVESQLKARDLSYYRIEQEQGLGNATISRPARFEQPPTLTICKALADAFDYPLEEVLRQAGHLPPHPGTDDYDPETRRDLQLITEIVGRLSHKRRRQALQELIHLARLVEDLDQGASADTVDSEREPVEVESDETR